MALSNLYFKLLVKQCFHRLGLDVRRYKPWHDQYEFIRHAIELHGVGLVCDVGANTGQFALRLRRAGYDGRILSFDPLSEAHETLCQAAKADPAWTVAERMALGAESGEMEINISEDSPSSSLLGQHPKMVSVRSDTRYVGKEPVTVRRLDEVVSDTAAIMVKMDVQGYEKQVLKGAAGIMGQIKIIFAEMPLEVLYEGAATFEELYRDIVKLGFRCTDIERGMIDKKRLETLQINALFVRSD